MSDAEGKGEKKKKKKKTKMKKGDFKKMDLSEAPLSKAELVEAPPDEKDEAKNSKDLEHKEDLEDTSTGKSGGGDEKGGDGDVAEGKEMAPPIRNPDSEVTLVVPVTPKPPDYEPGDKEKKAKKKGKFSLATSVETGAEKGSRPGTPSRPLTRIHANERLREEIDETNIHEYAWKGEYIAMEQLIGMRGLKDDQGKNYIRFLDSRDKHGNTALILASTRGFRAICELLVKSGASVDVQNFYGWTAMMFAVSQDNEEIVKLLLEHSANLRLLTPVDRQALDFASSPEVRQLLKDVLDRPTKIDEKLLLRDAEEQKLLLKN